MIVNHFGLFLLIDLNEYFVTNILTQNMNVNVTECLDFFHSPKKVQNAKCSVYLQQEK